MSSMKNRNNLDLVVYKTVNESVVPPDHLTKTIVLERDLSITKPDGVSFYVPWPFLQSVAAIPLFMLGWLLSGSSDPVKKEAAARFMVTFFCVVVFIEKVLSSGIYRTQ